MECLNETTVFAFSRGTLTPAERADAEAHIDVCATCSELVALCARTGSLVATDARAGDPLDGKLIDDRFILRRLAGEGTVGRVYRAEDTRSGTLVALKLLRDDGPVDDVRFEREARVLAGLVHPRVVRYIAHGHADGVRYLAMEWLEGLDLHARLSRGPLTVNEAMEIALHAAEGLGALHAAGVLHRDVKPSNLFLEDAQIDRLKVIDLGLAYTDDASAWTRTGAVLGTMAYIAPEQARGERGRDARSDVFSLGRVLFECLTGWPAFLWNPSQRTPRVSELVPGVPAGLDALVERMTSPEAADRPENGSDVARALREILDESAGELRSADGARAAPPEIRRLSPRDKGDDGAVLSPGTRFGRYRIEEVLGQGGMGRVYRAHDTVLRRDLALKLLRPRRNGALRALAEAPADLLREARAAAALNHPNVVSVFDVGEIDGTSFIAMELALGRPLRAYVGAADVDLREKVRWLVEVARALDAAHTSGLVHRDVKPENVIVGANGVAKVLDFGIAKWVGGSAIEGAAETELGRTALATRDGHVRGTPLYMAPEQLEAGLVDARSDQYAWGVVAYELLSGVRPWRSASSDAPLKPLDACAPGLPDEIVSVVMRALSADPRERFANMAEVASSLEGSRPSKRPRRRLGLLLLGAGCAVASIAVAAMKWAVPAAPTTLLDLPAPRHGKAEALAAYTQALTAQHDGLGQEAMLAYDRAIALDPALPQALLRSALHDFDFWPQKARTRYRDARSLRSLLDARDQALLDAAEPLFRQPSDMTEWIHRLDALVARRPRDAELAYSLGMAHLEYDQHEAAIASFDRAIASDPSFASAFAFKSWAQAYRGDLDGALDTLERCDRVNRVNSECEQARVWIFAHQGDAAQVIEHAQRILLASPEYWLAYRELADGMLARGDTDAARELLARRLAKMPKEWQTEQKLLDEMRLAALAGDFDAVARAASETLRAVASEADAVHHARPVLMLVAAATEMGDTTRAGEVARDFLARKDAWTARPTAHAFAVGEEPVMRLLHVERMAGLISKPTFDEERRRWLSAWDSAVSPNGKGYLWLHAYAAITEDADDASEALAALPSYGAVPPFRPGEPEDARLGWTYLLAGQADAGVPLVKEAAKACNAYQSPFENTWAQSRLGRALESIGDRAGACAAYRTVIARWGEAKPRSVTAEHAKERAAALGCR